MDSNIIAHSALFDMDSAASIFQDALQHLQEMARPNCDMYGDEENCTGIPAVSVAQMTSALRMACRDDIILSIDQGIDTFEV